MKYLLVCVGLNWYADFIPYQIYTAIKCGYECDYLVMVEKAWMSNNWQDTMDNLKSQTNSDIKIINPPVTNYAIPIINRQVLAKYMRFIIPHKYFKGYEGIYIGDIDMLFTDKHLFQSHEEHCNRINLDFSNAIRQNTKRLSGLHYFRPKKSYLTKLKMSFKSLNEAVNYLQSDEFKNKGYIDEELLYWLHDEEDMAKLLTNRQFRPHHGFHIGLLRSRKQFAALGNYKKECIKAKNLYGEDKGFLYIHNKLKGGKTGKIIEIFFNF